MRLVHALLAALCLAAGCQSGDPSDAAAPRRADAPPTKGGRLVPTASGTVETNTPAAAPVLLPTSGRIHSINLGLRFVVIDYTLGGMPALGSQLAVYRSQEKVGMVRLSGPERNGFVAGDITEGFLQVDDEVRVH
jgi:hypothetical protein